MEFILRDIVPSDAPSLAHIVVTANDHAFRGRIPDHCLEFTEAESSANWEHFLSQGLPADDLMLVAETPARECVGYVWAGRNTKDEVFQAELRQLMLLPAFQKQGIGRRLVNAIAQRLAQQGISSICVNVLRANPNRAFYEHLGGQFISEHPYDWDGVTLSECVYGWRDIRTLLINQPD